MQTHTAQRTVMSGDQAFYHLSLHSRHVAMQPRQEVLPEIVDILLPIVRKGCGMVPRMPGWKLYVQPMKDDGGHTMPGTAAFQIVDVAAKPELTAIFCYVCWNQEVAPLAWARACEGYRQLQPSLEHIERWREPPDAVPATPWLVVALTASSYQPRVLTFQTMIQRMSDMQVFGDLERCVAWTLIADEESRS